MTLRVAAVPDHAGGHADGDGVVGHGTGHDRVGADHRSSSHAVDDGRLRTDPDVVTDLDLARVESLFPDQGARVVEAVIPVRHRDVRTDEARLPDRDARRDTDPAVHVERGAIPDPQGALAFEVSREPRPEPHPAAEMEVRTRGHPQPERRIDVGELVGGDRAVRPEADPSEAVPIAEPTDAQHPEDRSEPPHQLTRVRRPRPAPAIPRTSLIVVAPVTSTQNAMIGNAT